MTGGMLPQQADTLVLINMCRAHNKPVVVGGPDATSSPHIYRSADFRVLGEAEGIINEFVAAWEAGHRSGTFAAPKFDIDVTSSPIPRFDLLKFDHYLYIGVQISARLPVYLRVLRYHRTVWARAAQQGHAADSAEIETLDALGYRGHVDFVDDNLIGNKKALKLFLPELKNWQEARNYPFRFPPRRRSTRPRR